MNCSTRLLTVKCNKNNPASQNATDLSWLCHRNVKLKQVKITLLWLSWHPLSSGVSLWADSVKYVLYTVQPLLHLFCVLHRAALCYFTALQKLNDQSQNNKTWWISFSFQHSVAPPASWTHIYCRLLHLLYLSVCTSYTHKQRGRQAERMRAMQPWHSSMSEFIALLL